MSRRKAVFLDRDGTLIVERNYLGDPAGVALLEGVPQALKQLSDAGFLLVMVTNQSGVARGFFTMDDVARVNGRVAELLEREGVRLDAVYICPHHEQGTVPEYAVSCACRKPKPGKRLEFGPVRKLYDWGQACRRQLWQKFRRTGKLSGTHGPRHRGRCRRLRGGCWVARGGSRYSEKR